MIKAIDDNRQSEEKQITLYEEDRIRAARLGQQPDGLRLELRRVSRSFCHGSIISHRVRGNAEQKSVHIKENPQVGVYVTEQNPSKMGWYIHRTSKVTRSTCGNDGSQTYHVEYKMTNTLENSQIGALTSYILGSGGRGVEKTLIYAPAGGSISNLKTSGGSVTESRQETLNGKPCMRAMPR